MELPEYIFIGYVVIMVLLVVANILFRTSNDQLLDKTEKSYKYGNLLHKKS